jgi:hypothetical protein
LHNERAGVKPARLLRLIQNAFDERVPLENRFEKESTWQSRLTIVVTPATI